MYAPGAHIVSVLAPNSVFASASCSCQVAGGQYIQTSGTSMAAPMIAGLVADLLQVHPRWTPDQVKGDLTSAAVSANSSLQEPNAVKAVLDWNPTVGRSGPHAERPAEHRHRGVNYTLGTWSLATWSRANGVLRAGFAGSSYTCKTCPPTAAAASTRASAPGTWAPGAPSRWS